MVLLYIQMNNYAQESTSEHGYGENLYASTLINNLGEAAVDKWYNEIIYYDESDDENQLYASNNIRKYDFQKIKSIVYLNLLLTN